MLLYPLYAVVRRPGGLWNVRKVTEELWAQARADYATASLLREAGTYYAAVFFAQQAAEKSLKAVSREAFGRTQRGHNLIAIADALQAPLHIMNCAAELNADYFAALYPEAAGGAPCRLYDQASATRHLQCAEAILQWARQTVVSAKTVE
jgi:HEPN domain-containing protein